MENKIKEMKVSKRTSPKLLATSILFALEDGCTIKITTIGDIASSISVKAIALANGIIKGEYELHINIQNTVVNTKAGVTNAILWTIKKRVG